MGEAGLIFRNLLHAARYQVFYCWTRLAGEERTVKPLSGIDDASTVAFVRRRCKVLCSLLS